VFEDFAAYQITANIFELTLSLAPSFRSHFGSNLRSHPIYSPHLSPLLLKPASL